jgi:four helix bundle protein
MDAFFVGRQLIKAATSVAANYRAACRSRSPAEFSAIIGKVAEEADESELWLDFTIAADIVADSEARRLFAESGQLTAIFTRSRDTAKANLAARRRAGTASMLAILAILAILAMNCGPPFGPS